MATILKFYRLKDRCAQSCSPRRAEAARMLG